ncbi:MAG: hypothetical protein JNK50_00980 [Bacteroidia bacterium]|nr:hypothetical protein [Bacteroidia bacterium]
MALNSKLSGSTLAEVLVAIALTSICATLAVVIYINIQQSTMPFIRIKANELASKYISSAIQKNEILDKEYKEEEFIIIQRVIRNNKLLDCKDIIIEVYNLNRKKLSELNVTIYAE